jgi:hypothetical protein
MLFEIPVDWSAAAWKSPFVMINCETFTASDELEVLVARSLDHWLGQIQRATETYCHIRRDGFVF